jgi:hypothetical protein
MKKLFKKLFCLHDAIETITEASQDRLLIIKTRIVCRKCNKSFANHPNALCCYVMHIQHKLIQEEFIEQIKSAKQP